jgi:hypothetical protein
MFQHAARMRLAGTLSRFVPTIILFAAVVEIALTGGTPLWDTAAVGITRFR